jgi:UPF0716 protein FxsA
MNPFARLALLFLLVPAVELALLIQLGQAIGWLPTLAMVLLTGVGGAALARIEGLRVLVQAQRQLAMGRLPGQALLDGVSVLIGGVLLLAPGVLTDLTGLVLLFPPTRRWIQRRVRRRLERRLRDGTLRVIGMRMPGFGGGAAGGPGGWSGFGGFGGARGPFGAAPWGPEGDGASGAAGEPDLDPAHEIVDARGEEEPPRDLATRHPRR